MRYRELGSTGIRVSEIGFGTWGIGGDVQGSIAYGATDDAESLRALERAFAKGINFYDTADLYGAGHSDVLLGLAFASRRDKVVIASKVGYIDATGRTDFSPRAIRTVLEASLRRLKCDYLDLYQLHDPPMALLEGDPEVWDTMIALKNEGKIRAAGVSVKKPSEAFETIARFAPDAVQINFNLVDQRALEIGIFDLFLDRKIGCIVRTPLCFGFLTGAYRADQDFAPGDHRRRWSPGQLAAWAAAPGKFRQLAERIGCSTTEFALRYCLSYPAVSTTIPGMLTATQVDENSSAGDLGPLGSIELREIDKIYRENIFWK